RDLVDADQLAVAVEDVRPCVDGLAPRLAVVWEDGRHAGPDRVGITVCAAHECPVPHTDTGHVRDGVQRAGLHAPDPDAQLACPRLRHDRAASYPVTGPEPGRWFR